MFDIGFQELIIIFIVALLVFGPKRLPELAKTLGKWVVEIKRGVYIAKSQIEQEFNPDFKVPDEDIIKNLPKDIAGTEETKEHHTPEDVIKNLPKDIAGTEETKEHHTPEEKG